MKMLRFLIIVLFGSSFFMAFSVGSLGSNLRDVNNRADYVIITPISYYALAETLAIYRQGKNNYTTMVINVDTVLAQFGSGVSPDTALKNFIQYALNNWSDPKPQYFVLAGNINTVPSHPEPESISSEWVTVRDTLLMIDQWFVEVPGTLQVNACIGRLPAWDSLGLSVMIAKTINYDQEAVGEWYNKAICLSDYDSSDGYIFENNANSIKSILGSLWSDTITVNIRSSSPNHLDTAGFLRLWNEGAAIITYWGHANQNQFSKSRYFYTESIDSLINGNQLPVCLLAGCDLLYDSRPPLSIPTHLLEKNGGGAVAVISSEGLSYESEVFNFYTTLINSMIQKPNEPIGMLFKEAKCSLNYFDVIRKLTFLGDPALIVKHPVALTDVQNQFSHPESFALKQNYPNPFNPTTVIVYQLPAQSNVTLIVFDMLGREVKTLVNDRQSAGLHSVIFNASGLTSGVYFYRLQAGSFTETKKLLFLK
ncbi:MAG: C25 family cysteine peptidase [Ignavibacteriales bacterium]|nr:C25 family cysteine peptidase [Ignavibacteriales bacterium]